MQRTVRAAVSIRVLLGAGDGGGSDALGQGERRLLAAAVLAACRLATELRALGSIAEQSDALPVERGLGQKFLLRRNCISAACATNSFGTGAVAAR
jgi:hypothetical protein